MNKAVIASILSGRYGGGLADQFLDKYVNFRYNDGFNLSDRVWRIQEYTQKGILDITTQGIMSGTSAVDLTKQVEGFLLKRGPAWTTGIKRSVTGRGTVAYNALRLARTEINQAYHWAQKEMAVNNPMLIGQKWNLSNTHPTDWPLSAAYMGYPEICDYRANHDHHGLGEGVFPPGEAPPDHPNGLCYLTDVWKPAEEILDLLGDPDAFDGMEEEGPELLAFPDKIAEIKTRFDNFDTVMQERLSSLDLKSLEDFQNARTLFNVERQEIVKEAGRIVMEQAKLLVNTEEHQELERMLTRINELTEKHGPSYPEVRDLKRAAWNLADKMRKSSARNAEQLRDLLGEIRPMGLGNNNIKKHLNNSSSQMAPVVEQAYSYYPTDWVSKSVESGSLTPRKAARGYYAHYEKIIAISGKPGFNRSLDTAIHELGHRFERVVPNLKNAEQVFYEERTKGEDAKWLGRGYKRHEVTRADDFLDPYIGKDYGGDTYELASRGFEMAYTDPTRIWKDEDYAAWIYGLLALY